MTLVFGQWKGFVMSIMLSLSTFLAILITCGCCLVPCTRRLFERVIVRAVDPEPEGPAHMMPLLEVEAAEWTGE